MVFQEENAGYWAEIVARKMSSDMKSDNVSNGPQETEHDKNVSDEFLDLENGNMERLIVTEKFTTDKAFDFLSCSEEFKSNNFGSENDFLKHYEESYENEYFKKLSKAEKGEQDKDHSGDQEEDDGQDVGHAIRSWLENMNRKLDFIYNRDIPEEYDSDEGYEEYDEEDYEVDEESEDDFSIETCVGDPFSSIDKINKSDICEIVSTVSDKHLSKAQGKCCVRLRDGSEIVGSWQEGRRTGPGSLSSPALEQHGVMQVVGNYEGGLLSGIGRLHMADESIREGWFCRGKADGPFRGTIKVV